MSSLMILAASVFQIPCGKVDRQTNNQTNINAVEHPTHATDIGVGNKYVGPLYCRAEMYAGRRVACCRLVSHGEYAVGTVRRTDGRTPDRYIMLSARRGQRNNKVGWLDLRVGGHPT